MGFIMVSEIIIEQQQRPTSVSKFWEKFDLHSGDDNDRDLESLIVVGGGFFESCPLRVFILLKAKNGFMMKRRHNRVTGNSKTRDRLQLTMQRFWIEYKIMEERLSQIFPWLVSYGLWYLNCYCICWKEEWRDSSLTKGSLNILTLNCI